MVSKSTNLLQLDQHFCDGQRVICFDLGDADLDHRIESTDCHNGLWTEGDPSRFISIVRIDLPGYLKQSTESRGAFSSR